MELHFEPVTSENRRQIEALRIFPEQAGYIESVEECLQEADAYTEWRGVGIYDGFTLVGFAMYGHFKQLSSEGQLWLDRLLIDKRYQGKRYGETAVRMLLDLLQKEYRQEKVYLSVYDSNQAAIRLYEKIGFHFNGEFDTKGEKIMIYQYR